MNGDNRPRVKSVDPWPAARLSGAREDFGHPAEK
jgi:hypothetical protein